MQKKFAALLAAPVMMLASVVPAYAANPITGDNFNLALGLGLGGGALVLIAIVLVLTKKKK